MQIKKISGSNTELKQQLLQISGVMINKEDGNLLIVSMVENVQDNSEGGSHYLIQKIRNII